MISKNIFSLLGFLFIGNLITKTFATEVDGCNITSGKDCISNSYYIVDPNNYKVLTDENATGDLYYCSGETVTCKGITDIGYFVVDKNTVFTCQDKGEGLLCQRGKIPESNTACNGIDKIGQLIYGSADVISLCLYYEDNASLSEENKRRVVDLNVSSSGNYFIHKNADPNLNVFGITGNNQEYAIITIKDKVVKLNSTYNNGLKYVYGEKKTYRVMERDIKNCPVDPTTGLKEGEILELFCSDGRCKNSENESKLSFVTAEAINLVKKTDNKYETLGSNDLTSDFDSASGSFYLLNCDSNKNCETINGYLKKGDDYYSITTSGGAEAIVSDTAPDCENKIGLVYKDEDDHDNYHVCLSKKVHPDISTIGNGYYVLGSGESGGVFKGVSNKILKITSDYIYVDSDFNAENSKLYFNKVDTDFYVYKYLENSHSFISDNISGIFVYQAMENAGNMYNEVNLEDPSLNRAITNWIMFDCIDDKCKQAYGYVKSKESTPKYYYLPYSGVSNNKQVGSNPTFSTCASSTDNGLLMSDGSLCIIGDVSSPTKQSMGDGEVFAISLGTNSPFATSGILYIKSTGNTVTFSENIAKKDIGIHLFTSGKEIQSSTIDDNNKTKLILYNCSDLRVCTAIAGYAFNNDKFYAIPATLPSADGTPSKANVCTNDSGKLIDDGTGIYLCTGTSKKVNLANPGFYALDDNALASPFADSNRKNMIQITDSLIGVNNIISDSTGDFLFKIDDTYMHYELSSGSYTAGDEATIGVYERCKDKEKNYINVYKKINISNTDTITEDSDVANWTLFDCTAGKCAPTYGYIKSGDEKYFSIAVDGTNSIVTNAILTSNACAASTDVGKLFNDGGTKKICVDGTSSPVVKVALSDTSYYLLSIAKPNVFAASEEGKSVVVKVKASSITLYHSTDPYNVYKLGNSAITLEPVSGDFTNADERAKLGIFKCDDSDICENVPGYALDTTYYAFTDALGGTEVPTSINTCNSGNIGKVATIGSKKYLCITGSDKVDITTPTADPNYYVIGSAGSESKLVANKIAKITNKYITTDESLNGNNYLVKKDDIYTAYNYETNKFTLGSSVSGIKTYKQLESSNLYEELDLTKLTLADTSKLLLFNCDSGICEVIHGKILIGGATVMICGDSDCNTKDTVLTRINDCDGEDDVSKVFIENQTLKMCLTKGTTPTYEVANLASNNVYYAGTSTSTYKKLIINDSKTIIIEQSEIGLFYVKNNVLVSSYSDGDSVVQCTGLDDTCSIISTYTATCTTGQEGTFTSEKKLCLGVSKKTGSLGTTGTYLIAYGASSGFSPLVKSGQFGVIKMTTNSIVPDTSKSYICVDENLVVTARASGTATCTSSKAYACNSNGVCQEGNTKPELPVFPDCPSSCTTGDGTAKTYCIKTDNTIHGITSASACLSATIATGVHVIDTSTYEEIELSTLTGPTDDSEIVTWMIYDCDANGICQRTYGYAKSSDSKYYAIGAGSIGNKVVNPDACSVVGGLFTGGNLCLTASDATGGVLGKEYLLSNLPATNIFTGTAITQGLIIKGSTNTFTLKLDVSGYHLAKGSEVTTSSPDTLVYCTSNTSCTTTAVASATIGYYKNIQGGYIKCTGTGCESASKDVACTSAKVGLLDNNGNLCVDTTAEHAAPFASDSTPVYYVISYDSSSSSNIFSSIAKDGDHYASVIATELSITLNEETKAAACYKNNKESSDGESTGSACTSASGTFLACTSGECTAPSP